MNTIYQIFFWFMFLLAVAVIAVTIIKNLSKLILTFLYMKYYYQLWPIVSRSPAMLNVAFPDYSVQYFVMSFPKNATVSLVGTIPESIRFWSITLYDTTGTSFQSWNDTLYPTNDYNLQFTTTQICAMIIRYYTNTTNSLTLTTTTFLPSTLPTILVEGRKLRTVTADQVIKNSNQLEGLLYKTCTRQAKKYNFSGMNRHQFFLGNPKAMQMMFPNSNAMYLITFPTSTQVIKIQGTLPPAIGRKENIRFVGFMACNLYTTRTDDSISDMDLSSSYTLYVAYTKEAAVQHGYKKGDKLLLWDASTNIHPVVIYRQVQIEITGLFTLSDASSNISGSAIQAIMGNLYPSVVAC